METVAAQVWSKSKVIVKGIFIGILVILLLIPTFFVTGLIEEREARQKEAIAEVSSKWAGRQTISGPVVVLPYWTNIMDANNKMVVTRQSAYFLPEELKMQAAVSPQERSRGIYKIILYQSDISMSGSFKNISLGKLKLPADKVIWNEAYVKMNVADTRGLNEELKLKWNDTTLEFAPQTFTDALPDGMTAPLTISSEADLQQVSFSSQININGSEQLLFTPLGKTTTVSVQARWPHPSFTGSMLPQQSNIGRDSFSATWKSLAHKRNFPQHWTGSLYTSPMHGMDRTGSASHIQASDFGVDLFIPVNGYQKTLRSIKYAVLCILLTFAAFFLIETAHKKNVHPFQYGLIGLALVLFYLLLLSISEYTGFNIAYIIAAVATISLIGWFVKGILDSGKLSLFLSTLLLLVYVYVFTILQLQDYALLFGSIGLFLSLAAIMYFTRKIRW